MKNKVDSILNINGQKIGQDEPTYFIADIAANHDGNLSRAIELINLAAEAGADAAKFQHFTAKTIVSDVGFKTMGGKQSHQSSWKKSVFEVYEDASVPRDWTKELLNTCKEAKIEFFSAPYDFEAIELLNNLNVPAHKIGSGDITWTASLEKISKSGRPIFFLKKIFHFSKLTPFICMAIDKVRSNKP